MQTPAAYNKWNENEDMIAFYLASIHAQLQQAYVGLALALSAGRAFVLPKVRAGDSRGRACWLAGLLEMSCHLLLATGCADCKECLLLLPARLPRPCCLPV